jgi:uncharacterized protein YidB (DUF937 family)
MGLLDSVIGALGAHGGSPGGGANDLLGVVSGLIQQHGGLGGLLQQFQHGGLGEVAQSWVSTGQNLPLTPDQLGGVLGGDKVAQIAQQLGLSHGDVLGQLSQMLPQVVDKLTPHGEVPQGSVGGTGDLGALLGGLMGGGPR